MPRGATLRIKLIIQHPPRREIGVAEGVRLRREFLVVLEVTEGQWRDELSEVGVGAGYTFDGCLRWDS